MQGADVPEPAAATQDLGDDRPAVLDQELSGLPDKYRAVLILSDLEGKTRKEVARQLGLPEGTAASRLTRARAMLAKRLARRGVAPSGVALPAVLSQKAAVVPASLVSSTIQAASDFVAGQAVAAGVVSARAAALAKGVLKTMLLNKLKAVTIATLLIALLGLGGGAFAWRGLAADYPGRHGGKETPPAKDEDLKKKLLELDEQWWKGDVETLGKLAADDLITVSGVGRYDKAALLEATKNRNGVDWTRRGVEVSRVSKDVAVVTYVYDCKIVLSDRTAGPKLPGPEALHDVSEPRGRLGRGLCAGDDPAGRRIAPPARGFHPLGGGVRVRPVDGKRGSAVPVQVATS